MTPPPDAVPVTSVQNPRVAAARKLRQPKERAARGAFLVEGPHAVAAAAAAARFTVAELFVTPEAAAGDAALVDAVRGSGGHVTIVADRVCAAIAETVHPQGVVAVVRTPTAPADVAALPGSARLVVVLDRVADPGNAGTVIRTADAVGADAVVLTRGSVDPYAGKVVRASAGSIFHVAVLTDVPMPDAVAALHRRGFQIFATARDGQPLDAVEDRLDRPTAWLLGNEAHGLDASARALADAVVGIPVRGGAESFNVAAAAAICLYLTGRRQAAADAS